MEYDQLFKNLLKTFFKQFIELFFPEVAPRLDWLEIEFLQQEKFTDIPAGESRIVDVVAKIATREGEPELILVHVDVEHPWRSTFPYRMFEYYALLRLRHRLPVFPIAILPERKIKGFEPETYSEGLFGHEFLSFNYFHIGLKGVLVNDYWDDDNPISWGFASLMDSGERERALLLIECYCRVRDSSLNEAEKSLLLNFIVTCFQLTPDEEADFQRLLKREEHREVREMRETYFDKLKRQGAVEAMQNMLSKQLQAKFGSLPQEIVDRVRKIESEDELQKIAEKFVTASSLVELGLDKV
ncbi:hypothetical protein H8E77_02045 [bacterium]|nr:hypothetical protein [bacterium]